MGSRPRPATYGEYSLTMTLLQSIDMQRLLVTRQTCATVLATRRDIPEGLKRLITELFRRGAITQCSISYGGRMDLALARQDGQGHLLLVGRALDHFSTIFAEITGEQIAATWQASGSQARGSSRGSSIDGGALLRAFATVVDVMAEGLQVAAAIKILTDD